jgi:hypothetical protein
MRKLIVNALLGAALCMSVANAEIIVKLAPPKLRVEHRPAAPSRDHVWVSGYHRWDGHAYVWEPGRWEAPPHPHAVWIAPRWEHRHDGYVFVEGRWK